eukprot:Polyplicarium_translucidae@DN3240_c0_g1_i1.p1
MGRPFAASKPQPQPRRRRPDDATTEGGRPARSPPPGVPTAAPWQNAPAHTIQPRQASSYPQPGVPPDLDPFVHLARVPVASVEEWPIGFSPAHPNAHLASQLKAKFGILITDDLSPADHASGENVVPLVTRDVRELSNHLRWALYQKAADLKYPVPIVEAVGTDGGCSTARLVVCADMLSRGIFLHMETMKLRFDDPVGGVTRIRFVPFQVAGYPTFPIEKDLRLPSAALPADYTRVFWPADQAIDGSSGGAEAGVDARTLETLRERLCLTIHFKPRSWNAQQLGLFLDSLFERLRAKCNLTKPRVSEVMTAIGTCTAIVAFTDEMSRMRVLFLRAAYLPSSEAASNERSGMRGFLYVTPFRPEHLPMSLGQMKSDTRPCLALPLGSGPSLGPPVSLSVADGRPVREAVPDLSLLDGLQKVVQSMQQQHALPPVAVEPVGVPQQRPAAVLTAPCAQTAPPVAPLQQQHPTEPAEAAKSSADLQPLLSALSSLASSLQHQRETTDTCRPQLAKQPSRDPDAAPPSFAGSIPPTAAARLAEVASQLSALQQGFPQAQPERQDPPGM